jgi:lipoate-protein ligase A
MLLVRDATRRRPSLDAALSHALLQRVARGEQDETLRVYRPAPTVAFGRLDELSDGFSQAVAVARSHAFTPVLRAPGGRPAAYDDGSVLFDLVLRAESPLTGAQDAFARSSEALAAALRDVGVDARVGPVEGEYCRGDFSVNAGGSVKIVGTAQRRVRGASLLGGFVTVEGAARLRAALTDVYRALAIDWDPATLGGIATSGVDEVERAVVAALAPDAEQTELDAATLALAAELEPRHAIEAP